MKRQPEGVPTGGQFAAERKTEPTSKLAPYTDEQDADAAIAALGAQIASPDPKEKRHQHRADAWSLEKAQGSLTIREVAEAWRGAESNPHAWFEQTQARRFAYAVERACLKREQAARTITDEQRADIDAALVKVSEAAEGDSNDAEMDAYDDAISEAVSLIDVDLSAKPDKEEAPYVGSLRRSFKAMDKAANGDSNDMEFEAKADALNSALHILGIERP